MRDLRRDWIAITAPNHVTFDIRTRTTHDVPRDLTVALGCTLLRISGAITCWMPILVEEIPTVPDPFGMHRAHLSVPDPSTSLVIHEPAPHRSPLFVEPHPILSVFELLRLQFTPRPRQVAVFRVARTVRQF